MKRTFTVKATPHGVLGYLMDEHKLAARDLARILSVKRSTAYALRSGTRNLTVTHIQKLCAHFGISADTFLGGRK